MTSLDHPRYRQDRLIAVGGMGRVHQVKHLHLGKVFALKQMHDSFSSDQSFRAKFYQEARIASGLSHRNIVSIVDFGEDPVLGVFMVMELVEGEPMSRRLRNKVLTSAGIAKPSVPSRILAYTRNAAAVFAIIVAIGAIVMWPLRKVLKKRRESLEYAEKDGRPELIAA